VAQEGHAAIPRLAEHAAGVLGLPAWNASQGHGSFLTFEFGDERLDASGRLLRGDWHLWIQMAAWRIEDATAVLAACEDGREVIAGALGVIEGRALTSVVATGPALDTVFSFSDVHVRTFSLRSRVEEDASLDSWWLFRPDDRVLAVTERGTWTVTAADSA
jgi:hypothetical protein